MRRSLRLVMREHATNRCATKITAVKKRSILSPKVENIQGKALHKEIAVNLIPLHTRSPLTLFLRHYIHTPRDVFITIKSNV